MSYSNSGGGTLTLPSPTHVRHVDVTSAVRSLRRSLSRSPSKFNLKVQKSPAHSPKSSLSPSPSTPASPSKLGPNRAGFFGTPTHGPSPLAKPFPPSVKLSLRSASRAKNSPTTATKTRTSPRSPLKRVLSESYDRANSQPPPGVASRNDQENRRCENISQIERRSLEKQSRDKNMFNLDVTGPINQALARLEGTDSGPMIPSTSSPLKRSDAIMNLDQASLGSPVAKRRSLHGSASFGHDFNVFDHAPTSSPQFDIHDDTNSQDHERPVQTFTAGNASMFSMPKRSSSLRKSTLQQRQEKSSSWGRRHGHAAFELSSLSNEYSTPAAPKNRPRLSLDQFVAPMPRDSPFSSQGSLPNASIHMFNPQQQLQQKQHPLSRSTLTTSSSDSSMADESPTHVPPHFGQQPRPKLDFSKSLPVGALRPLALEAISREEFGSKTFSTPENYKSAKPLPAAFMSTGLISKVKNHPNQPAVSMQDFRKSNMPDTPCKKPLTGYNTMPTAAVAGSAIARARQVRHSFGAPSTPFNPYGTESQGAFDQAGLVFGSSFSNRHRRGSFISNDGDEPENQAESQSDYDFPPTPTKQTLVHNTGHKQSNGSPQSLRGLPIPAFGAGMARYPRMSSKLCLLTCSLDSEEDSEDYTDLYSPTTAVSRLSSNSSVSMSSFRRSRALRRANLECPTPLSKSLTTPFLSPFTKPNFAKIHDVAPASPLDCIDFNEKHSPHTPQEDMLPPNASRLSLSARKTRQLTRQATSSGPTMAPPATPTAGRESFNADGGVTPVNGSTTEVDEGLMSRFEKIELIGTGEFSVVYRVTQPQNRLAATQPFYFGASGSPLQSRSPPSPLPGHVFAVKKARQPYQGARDRQRKLQEVSVLKALGQSDHVVHLIDSWEKDDYLYIQTEYCEEGSLDVFLSQVGRKGRLDDFRIWKIMLELGQVSILF